MAEQIETKTKARRRGIVGWLDVRGRRLGTWAFVLNRLTGLGLVLYLGLHLVALGQLALGAEYYDAFVEFAHNPLIIFMDIVLIFGMIFHGLNGIRVALVGMGVGVQSHKKAFWALSAAGAVILVVSAWLVLTL